MKKVSEWLKENVSSHEIYDNKSLVGEFRNETGEEPCWPVNTVGRTNTTLGHFKGLQEEIQGNESEQVAYGWEIAEALASKYASYSSPCSGRGFIFRGCIEALEKVNR